MATYATVGGREKRLSAGMDAFITTSSIAEAVKLFLRNSQNP